MRKGLIAASVLALLAVLYAAAGHWLAPRFVRDALVEQASRQGLDLRLAEVRTDPFALSVVLRGVELLGPAGRTLAAARSASADFAWASLWRRVWIVEKAELHQPSVELLLQRDGRFAWGGLVADTQQQERQTALRVQQLVVSEGAVQFIDRSRAAPVELKLEALALQANGVSTQSGEAQYTLAAEVAGGGSVSSQGTFALEPLAAHGDLRIAGAALAKAWQLAAPGTGPAQGQLQASAWYAYESGRLLLREVSIEAADFAYAGLELPQLFVEAPQLAVPLEKPFPVVARASIKPTGSLSARGTIGLQPVSAQLKLEAADVPLAQAQRWLPPEVAVKIVSGALSANGALRIKEAATSYEGAVALRGVRLEEGDSGNLLLGWKLLETGQAKLSFAPFGAEIGELVAQAPQGRLIIEEDGRVNFVEVFRRDADEGGERPHIALRRLRIENGTLQFADRSLENAFEATIRELSGVMTGLSTAASDPARVQLAGRVQKYGSAHIRGTINLDDPKSLANITANFRNLDLAAFTPYTVKFAGYAVRSGRVSAELRYRVRDGRLVGDNQLVFERLQLGEKVQSADALDLPLELAVALLADAKGTIHLDIPVRGNLNDPQFDFGGLVARAIGNAIGKVVSAPFRALAALLGSGGGELAAMRFEPGSTRLAPPEEEKIAQLAQALAERPQLELAIRGGYDPQADTAALRRQTVRREVARRAGYQPKTPVDFGDPKILQAAENLFLQTGGGPLELIKLRAEGRRYGRLLLERLAAATPVEPGTLQTLAQARAETVRAALLTQGIEPSRLRLEEPSSEEAGDEGVPTLLSLSAEPGKAAAGATARPRNDVAQRGRTERAPDSH